MKQLNTETQVLLERYCRAACHLYGIIKLSKLLSIYNLQNEPISEEDFLNYINEIEKEHRHYSFVGEDEFYEDVDEVTPINRDLVAEYLIADEDDFSYYYNVKESQAGKPYYVPEKDDFLRYEDESYHKKTLSFMSLRSFFRNQPSLTKERADEITEDVCLSVNVYRDNLDSVINLVSFMFEFNDYSTLKEFKSLYMDLYLDTKLHIHCGYSPTEIIKFC